MGGEDIFSPNLYSTFMVEKISSWKGGGGEYDLWGKYTPLQLSPKQYFVSGRILNYFGLMELGSNK